MINFLRKIFAPQTEAPNEPRDRSSLQASPVRENIEPDQLQTVIGETRIEAQNLVFPQLVTGCAQSVGLQRDHNEDALFALTASLASDHTSLPFGLYIVADGMGGHLHGEIASGIAVRSVASYVIGNIYTLLLSTTPISPDTSIQEIMRTAVLQAHRSIVQEAPGSGTTLTAALILGQQMTIAHVGDSRAYAISLDGKVQSLTHDHSLVKRLVELGQITEEEAATHPQRNVLYRALGQGDPFDPDISTLALPETGFILLCSDGLWGVVPEEQIFGMLATQASPEKACQSLVDAANRAGGPDNITAILIRLPD